MKSHAATLQLALLLAAALAFGSQAFCQPAIAQPSPVSGINPATGPPAVPPRPPAIDPTTGRPVPVAPTRSVPPDADSLSPLSQARELMNRGRFEDALQGYLSYYTQGRGSPTNGPLASALSDWVELGQRYPKAKQALLDIRDSDTREFAEGRGNPKLFGELADINAALGEKDHTYALFLGIEQSDAPLAQECYYFMEPALVERGEYEVCARYLGNPQTRFDSARRTFEMGQGLAQQLSPMNGGTRPYLPARNASDTIAKAATDSFVRSVSQLLEILVATGRQGEAEKLRAQALATLDDPRLQPAISDVEARVRTVQASLRPPPMPIEIHPQFAENSTLFAPELPAPSASVERWSPKFEPGTKPDVQEILSAAKEYAAENQYEESLQRHLWYHNHALEYDPEGQRGVRLSFALSYWAALGRKYPKARDALLEIRDRDLHEFAQGRGSVGLFKDIAAINKQWACDSTTCRLFKYLEDQQPELAKRCYSAAEDALVKKGEYVLCLAYVGDGQARFKEHCKNWERLAQWEQHMGQMMQQAQQKRDESMAQNGQKRPAGLQRFGPPPAADNLLVGHTRQLIEILVGAGHKADAENIRTQALALLDEPRLQSAVSDAEKKLGQ
jgi:hypothetical protein